MVEFLSSDHPNVVNRPMVDLTKTFTSVTLNFYSDASAKSTLGFGCILNNGSLALWREKSQVLNIFNYLGYVQVCSLGKEN